MFGFLLLQQEVGLEELHPAPACWRADPRLERSEQDQCQKMLTEEDYVANNVTLTQLFPEGEWEYSKIVEWSLLLSNVAITVGNVLLVYRQMDKSSFVYTTDWYQIFQ